MCVKIFSPGMLKDTSLVSIYHEADTAYALCHDLCIRLLVRVAHGGRMGSEGSCDINRVMELAASE